MKFNSKLNVEIDNVNSEWMSINFGNVFSFYISGLYVLFIAIALIAVHTVHSAAIQDAVDEYVVPNAPGTCPVQGRARVAHETECNAYYDCANGKRSYVKYCPQNTFFNPYIESCDLAANVECAEDFQSI